MQSKARAAQRIGIGSVIAAKRKAPSVFTPRNAGNKAAAIGHLHDRARDKVDDEHLGPVVEVVGPIRSIADARDPSPTLALDQFFALRRSRYGCDACSV